MKTCKKKKIIIKNGAIVAIYSNSLCVFGFLDFFVGLFFIIKLRHNEIKQVEDVAFEKCFKSLQIEVEFLNNSLLFVDS